jgi:hypothetical protein
MCGALSDAQRHLPASDSRARYLTPVMRSNATLFYTGIAMVSAGLVVRFVWPGGSVGIGVGYGLTVFGVLPFVLVIRRGRRDAA